MEKWLTRRPHKPKIVSSNLTPATKQQLGGKPMSLEDHPLIKEVLDPNFKVKTREDFMKVLDALVLASEDLLYKVDLWTANLEYYHKKHR